MQTGHRRPVTRRMRIACWVPKPTDTHSEYLLIFHSQSAFVTAPDRYTDIACLVVNYLHVFSSDCFEIDSC